MDQDVEDEVSGLALEGQDDVAVGLEEDESEEVEGRIDLCLVGKFLTKKKIDQFCGHEKSYV